MNKQKLDKKVEKVNEVSSKVADEAHATFKSEFAGFLDFIRSHGIVTLAIGFIIGGAVTKTVNSLVNDIINPFIGIFLKQVGNLDALVITIGTAEIMVGKFISELINLLIISLIIYYGVKLLKLDKIDKPKE